MKSKEEIKLEQLEKDKRKLETDVKRLTLLNSRQHTENKRLLLKLREENRRYQLLERELQQERRLHQQQILENKRLEDKWLLDSHR
jgi:hypothetical protein